MQKEPCTVHEVEIEAAQEAIEEGIETVSINSIYLNKNQSLITAHLKTQVRRNSYRDTIQN